MKFIIFFLGHKIISFKMIKLFYIYINLYKKTYTDYKFHNIKL